MKLRVKFILFFLTLIILLVGGLMYYVNTYISNYLKQTAINNLRVIAELSESAYFTFTDLVKTRTVDWSSDGYIRNAAEKMLSAKARGDNEEYQASAKALGIYLREEKMKYGSDVIIIDILDGNGIVIVSSREDRVGADEKEEEERLGAHRFSEAIRLKRPEAFVNHMVFEADESDEPMIHAVARLFSSDKNSDGSLVPLNAVLLLHFSNVDTLAEILSGRRQMEKGALSGRALYERYETAEVYLVNEQHLMISPARDNPDSVLRQRVDTPPVHNCFNNKQEIAGEYASYSGKTVIGASMCLVEDRFVLIAEVEKDEILEPMSSVQRALAVSGALVAAIGLLGIMVGGYWLLRPLFEIINIAQEAASGNLRARASVKTKDEIGHLAEVFNQMLDSAQRKDMLMSLIKDIVIDINEARGTNNVYQTIIDEICVYGNWPVGHVYLKDKNSDVLISTKIWHLSDPEKFKAFKEVTEKTNFEKGAGLPGRVLESKSPIWISDVAKDTNFPRAKLMENINVGAAFGFPVVSGDNKIIAIFEFFSAEPREMENGFLEVIKNISSQINGVVEKIKSKEQLEEKVKERTKELMKLKVELEKMVSLKTVDLEKKLDELEKFKKLTIDRELKMIELKKRIEELGGNGGGGR